MKRLLTYILLFVFVAASGQYWQHGDNFVKIGDNFIKGEDDKLSFYTNAETFTGTVLFTEGNLFINWGDGHKEHITTSGDDNLSHTYTSDSNKVTIYFSGGYEAVRRIDISVMNCYGDLSTWDISGFNNLVWLYIYINNFEGDLSAWDISGLNNLEYLYISNNNFEGDLSAWDISALNNLRWFYIHNNNFEGDLSSWDISGLNNLARFYIHRNNFASPPILSTASSWSGGLHYMYNNVNMTATTISNYLVGMDDYDGSGGTIDISGCNGGTLLYNDLTTDGKAAYDNMVNNKGWTIETDDP